MSLAAYFHGELIKKIKLDEAKKLFTLNENPTIWGLFMILCVIPAGSMETE